MKRFRDWPRFLRMLDAHLAASEITLGLFCRRNPKRASGLGLDAALLNIENVRTYLQDRLATPAKRKAKRRP